MPDGCRGVPAHILQRTRWPGRLTFSRPPFLTPAECSARWFSFLSFAVPHCYDVSGSGVACPCSGWRLPAVRPMRRRCLHRSLLSRCRRKFPIRSKWSVSRSKLSKNRPKSHLNPSPFFPISAVRSPTSSTMSLAPWRSRFPSLRALPFSQSSRPARRLAPDRFITVSAS